MRWTPQLDELLKSIYCCSPKSDILTKISQDWMCICRRARRLGLHRDQHLIDEDRKKRNGPRKDSWTYEEDLCLKNIYPIGSKEEILKMINRSWASINSRAHMLGVSRNSDVIKRIRIDNLKNASDRKDLWSGKEDEFLKQNYSHGDKDKILSTLNRTWKSIRFRAQQLGLIRDRNIIQNDRIKILKHKNMERYGVNSTFELPAIQSKIRKTNQIRRGVNYPTESPEVRNKIKNKVRSVFGVDNVFQSSIIRKKIINTNRDRYGVDNPNQSVEIRRKTSETCTKRYGVDNPFKLTDRVQHGMFKKYGRKSPLQVQEIKNKFYDTNIKKYGFRIPVLSPEIRNKIRRTNLERYGSESPFDSPVIKEKIRKTIQEFGFNQSKEEALFWEILKTIDEKTEHHKEHPDLRHTIDFYMPKYDLWVQYDGDYWHGKKLPNENSRQYNSIIRTIRLDREENLFISNLLRFSSEEVNKAIKDGSISDIILKRIESKNACHQYMKKCEYLEDDLKNLDFDPTNVNASDLDLNFESFSNDIRTFIEKYDYLGKIGVIPKWCFTARYHKHLAGVVIINEPVTYSKILGNETPKYEALIQRGASSSWAPINAGSRLIMFACHWMVRNTPKRIFVGYADPQAGEIGTIYQACNFDYLGNNFGDKYLLKHMSIKHGKIFSPHSLKRTSSFKSWCNKYGIIIDKNWFKENGFKDIKKIPHDILSRWYEWINKIILESEKIKIEPKGKYVMILGKNKQETKYLNILKKYIPQKYPKRSLNPNRSRRTDIVAS